MGNLAIEGGKKIFESQPALEPSLKVYPETGKLLNEIYMSRKWSFYGEYENLFNKKFAEYHNAEFGVFMANGTVTLECALEALGVGPGDEVIAPAYTWIATGMAPLYVGAVPVIVDIEPDTLCLDPDAFEAAVTPRTKAVIPVHLFGSMADMERINAIAKKYNIAVIEDCAHAHGGFWNGRGVGSVGDIGSFSFQQSKLMTSGEGGFCATNDERLWDRLGRLKHIGYSRGTKQGETAPPPPEGLICHNYRATEFQAAILLSQLEHLKEDTELRAANADFLREKLDFIPGIRAQAKGRLATMQSYYMFQFMVDETILKPGIGRPEVAAALQAEGLGAWPGWGDPIYTHNLWNVPGNRYILKDCSIAERIIHKECLLLGAAWLMAERIVLENAIRAVEKVMLAYLK